MAGHLCRCGAYLGIYEAIQGACEGRFDDGDVVTPPRVEAEDKVTGRAVYTVDVRHEGQLEGLVLRSPHASARVLGIDTAAASAMPGVRAVVELVDARRRVRYVGEPVAALAAVDRHAAEAALARIAVSYEVTPAAVGAAAAAREGAPAVYPEHKKQAPTSAEMPPMPARWEGNVRQSRVDLASKNAKKARRLLEEARAGRPDHVVSAAFHTSGQSHTALEPHACVARWTADKKVTVHVSTQSCWSMAIEIAERFGLRPADVEVRCEHVGGAFGGKQSLTTETIAAVELSRRSRAPVRVAYDRLEEMTDGGYRPGTSVELSLVADEAGAPISMCGDIRGDAGSAIDSIVGVVLSQVYSVPHRSLREADVVSNLPPGKPFRGPGGPPASWAIEQAVDMMAERLHTDPIALRQRWDPHPGRGRLYAWASELEAWKTRRPAGAATGRVRRGVGVAMGNWLSVYGKKVQVEVAASAEGISVACAAQDMGNGARSVLAQAVAGVFGVSPLDVAVTIGVSSAPRGVSSAASATTNAVYSPAVRAAEVVRDRLVAAAKKLGLREARAGAGGVDHAGGHRPWRALLSEVPPVRQVEKRGTDAGVEPLALLPIGASGATLGKGNTGAVAVAEVEVDTRLGRVRARRMWIGINAGKIVVPALARSQIYGGVIQGVGYALYEERQIDENTGQTLSFNLEDYRIPGIADVPEVVVHFDEEGFEHVKGGAAGLSELSTVPIAAVIGNAVYNATGWRATSLPIRPERVLEGIRS
jgi:xanthine dehydrogenase YagR molybdenum-binding subunit